MLMPPLPAPDIDQWTVSSFAPPGLESVNVLRPAHDPYINRDPLAPALVLVPGLSMDARSYVRQLPLACCADIHVLQANNQAVKGEQRFGHFAKHVEEYIIANKLEQRPGGFVLGGSSMGGSISLTICSRGRVKPRALVLIGTFGNSVHLPAYQRIFSPLSYVLPLNLTKYIIRKFADAVTAGMRMIGRDWRYLGGTYHHRTHGYYGRACMALTRQNQIPQAQELTIPTLIVHGQKDWVLPHAAGEELAHAIPGSKFISFKEAGHTIFYTHAEELNGRIAEFLSTLRTAQGLPPPAPAIIRAA